LAASIARKSAFSTTWSVPLMSTNPWYTLKDLAFTLPNDNVPWA
jgi:hypothetical protein